MTPFKTMTVDGTKNIFFEELFADKKVVLLTVPGIFTSTCSNNHIPDYIENFDAIFTRGTDTIAVVSSQ